MKLKHVLVLLVVLAILAVGCDSDYQLVLEAGAYVVLNDNMVRYIDAEAGVVCWIYSHQRYQEGGISCMPLRDTWLER